MTKDSTIKTVENDFKADIPEGGVNTVTTQLVPGYSDEKMLIGAQTRGGSSSGEYGLATDTSTQSVSATSTADGTLGTITVSGGITSGTNSIIVPTTGVYRIIAGARWASGADGNLRGISVTASGTFITPMQDIRPILSANDTYLCCSGVAQLSANDSIKLRVYNGDSSSRDCIARRLSVEKIA